MSKPDPADGSLESILASIRKSLSEQSTDALSEAAAPPADQDRTAKSSRKPGLTERLAGAAAKPSPADVRQAGGDDLSDLLVDSADKTPPAPALNSGSAAASPAPAPADSGENDPLWFLTRREEPVAEAALPPLGAAEPQDTPAEPALTRPEVVRATMPPFFGSSETSVAPAVDQAAPPVSAPKGAQPQSAGPAGPPAADPGIAREVSLVAAAAEAAARSPQPAPTPRPELALNGKGAVATGAAPEPSPTGDMPNTHALEVMVLDLLKPMLRQWLDQNMPRLVAEALGEEVQRSRAAGNPKKT